MDLAERKALTPDSPASSSMCKSIYWVGQKIHSDFLYEFMVFHTFQVLRKNLNEFFAQSNGLFLTSLL